MFHTATVKPGRSGPRILYNTPLTDTGGVLENVAQGTFHGLDKNLGRPWLTYTGLQGNFYMLQLMTDYSGHFTHPVSYHVRIRACSDASSY